MELSRTATNRAEQTFFKNQEGVIQIGVAEENEKKKSYLRRYRSAKRQEILIAEQIQELRGQKMFPSVQNDGMPHGNQTGDLSGYAAKLDELLNEMEHQRLDAVLLYQEIQQQIHILEDETEKEVLKRRYLLGQSWETIAVEMSYNYRTVLKIHGRALKNFQIPERGH